MRRSIKHLLFYSVAIAGFKFINIANNAHNSRIVLMKKQNGTMLNVIIEGHYLEMNTFEITVKKAMCVDDFRLAAGQYCIEIDEDSSVLKKWHNNKLLEIHKF